MSKTTKKVIFKISAEDLQAPKPFEIEEKHFLSTAKAFQRIGIKTEIVKIEP